MKMKTIVSEFVVFIKQCIEKIFIHLNAYLKSETNFKINNLGFHLLKLEK